MPAYATIAFGVAVMVISVIMSVMKLVGVGRGGGKDIEGPAPELTPPAPPETGQML